MDGKTMNYHFMVDGDDKQTGTPFEFGDKNIKVENKFSTIHIPIPKKPGEIDLKIKTNVSVPVKKDFGFFHHWSSIISILCVILVVGMMKYQNSELGDLRLRVLTLSKQVDILNVKSLALREIVVDLQDKLDSVMSEHVRVVRDVSLFDDDSEDMSDVSQNTSGAKDSVVTTDATDFVDQSLTSEGDSSEDSSESLPLSVVDATSNNTVLQGNETALEIILKNSNRVRDLAVSAIVQGVRLERTKRSNKRGATLLHLQGGRPDVLIQDRGTGLIAPWHIDEKAAGDFPLTTYQMAQASGSVEITEPGLYYIYAQVYYLTPELSNSFIISLNDASKTKPTQDLAVCSVNGSSDSRTSEVTCFTSVVHFLNTTDRVFLRQRERNRRLLFKEGYSFLGIVNLNSMSGKKINI